MTEPPTRLDQVAVLLNRAQDALREYSNDYSWEAAEFLDDHAPWLVARLREVEAQLKQRHEDVLCQYRKVGQIAGQRDEARRDLAMYASRAEKAEARVVEEARGLKVYSGDILVGVIYEKGWTLVPPPKESA